MNRNYAKHILAGILILLFASILYMKGMRNPGGTPTLVPAETPGKIKNPDVVPTKIDDDPTPAPEETPDRKNLRNWIEKLGRATVLRDKRSQKELKESAPKIRQSDLPYLLSLLSDPLFLSAGTAELFKIYRLPESILPLEKVLEGSAYLAAKGVAIEALAVIGGATAEQALIKQLSTNSDTGVRARIATALGQFKDLNAHKALVEALRNETDSTVRRYIGKALRRLPSPETVDVLIATMHNEPNSSVLAELAIATYQSGGESALPRIREILDRRPEARTELQNWLKLQEDAWYDQDYAASFFQSGQKGIPYYPRFRKIGITVDPATHPISTAIAPLFQKAPLDRYRDFFYIRIEKEWLGDLASGTNNPRAYDVDGRPVPGGIPVTDLDGTVHLRFLSGDEFSPGILGFTEGNKASVTPTSLLHEFGHALANLGDEYNHPFASDAGGANLDSPNESPKWESLVEQGFIGPPIPRSEKVIPSNNCYMNNHPTDNRWCPVCQLALMAKICDLSGASAPW